MPEIGSGFSTPILFLIFNRPEPTQLVFNEIRKIKPLKLFIAADGPRPGKDNDIIRCEQTLDIVKNIDWECEVKTLYRKANLGCKMAVSTAITWFFEHVENGIILEDDCIPDLSFFEYCSVLLIKYQDNEKIMMISGNNFTRNKVSFSESYYFSKYIFIWGWATWRRAWARFDITMKAWFDNSQRTNFLSMLGKHEIGYWANTLDKTARGLIDTWDFQWAFTALLNNLLIICPSVNLVTNIGEGLDATHTTQKNRAMLQERKSLSFPLIHPSVVSQNIMADRVAYNWYFGKGPFLERIANKIRKAFLNFCAK